MKHLTAYTALLTPPWILLMRTSSVMACLWSEHISLPVLTMLRSIGSRISFSLLEWGFLIIAALSVLVFIFRLFLSGPARAVFFLGCCILKMLLCLWISFCLLWIPPLHASKPHEYTADEVQMTRLCTLLARQINADNFDFSCTPDDLPAKYAFLPLWMDLCGVSGFFSFWTGEALVSRDLPDCALPFVAVHEDMHARGIASEGLANIAAWEECISRGGAYAASARLWALKYALSTLDAAQSLSIIQALNPRMRTYFLEMGGIYRAPKSQKPISSLLGMEADYEILASYLACRIPV